MQYANIKKYRFPIRHGNRFKLLVDGENFFSSMLEAIRQAEHYILLEQYLINSGRLTDRFIQQLGEAAQRDVSVYALLDDYGANGLLQPDRDRLEQAGVTLCFFNPVRFKRFFHSLFRNHRKSLIVDGRLAFAGGAGLSDEFSAKTSGPWAWHDVMLEIHGPLVHDWCQLFAQTWQKQSAAPLAIQPVTVRPQKANQTGRLLTATPLQRQEINRALINQLRRAQHRAWITSPYFVAPRKIRRNLRRTAQRDVDVRLLLPGPFSDHPWINHAARRHYMRLLKSRVRIFEYQPRFIHAKIELCDDWVSIGSSNLDRWNQHWNLDSNQAIYDKAFASDVADLFMTDFAASKEITLQAWQRRPWYTRLKENLSGWVIFWLERLGRMYR